MARAATVTIEDVVTVIQALQSEGTQPSVAAVRGRLGRGSMTTVSRLVAEAMGRTKEPAAVAVDLEPPKEVLDRLVAAGAEVYRSLMREHHQRATALHASIDEERKVFRADMAQVAAESFEAHERAEIAEGTLAGVREELAVSRATAQTLRDEISRLQLDMDAERARLGADIADLRQRLAGAETTTLLAQEQREAAIVESATLRGRITALEELRAADAKRPTLGL